MSKLSFVIFSKPNAELSGGSSGWQEHPGQSWYFSCVHAIKQQKPLFSWGHATIGCVLPVV